MIPVVAMQGKTKLTMKDRAKWFSMMPVMAMWRIRTGSERKTQLDRVRDSSRAMPLDAWNMRADDAKNSR